MQANRLNLILFIPIIILVVGPLPNHHPEKRYSPNNDREQLFVCSLVVSSSFS